MTQRHVPERTCVGCRTQQPKRMMIRIVRTPEGSVVVDATGKQAGRGAYLCRRSTCWDSGLRRGALKRALKASIPTADRDALLAYASALPTAGERDSEPTSRERE